VTNLQIALRTLTGKGLSTVSRFRVKPTGRFDAAIVPARSGGDVPDRWLLAIEENLSLRDQVALYAHACGHLLFNHEQEKMGRLPQLDPRDEYLDA
jgi:hypothetical protein